MHIDWFVFFAQIVNFLILVFALKYLLYGRIIKAMDERETKIVSRLDEAERLKKEAQEAAAECEQKNQSLNEMAEEMMNKAREAAENSRRELTQTAREEVDQIQQRWYEALGREKKAFLESLSHRAGTYVYDTIRKILSDLADAELEQMVVNVFIRQIKEAENEKLSILSETPITEETIIAVRSAFELSAEQRKMISDALKPYLARDAKIRYEPLSDEIAGIEMMVHGNKFSWSINDYIASLEESFSRVLKEELPSVPDA